MSEMLLPARRCLHCERRPRETPLGLCPKCDAHPLIRELYLPRRGESPLTEERLFWFRERIRQGLPLFPDTEPDALQDAS